MTQSESYDLQTQQRMAASQQNGKILGRFDPIHVILGIATIIFLILSIVFIILFATKHDGSSGFLSTGFSDNKQSDVANDLRNLLNKKYTVNSFAVDVQNKAVSAVFSLRNKVSADEVNKVLAASKMVSQLETTYGDKATAVCRQVQFVSTAAPPATNPTTVTTKAPAPPVTDAPTSAVPPVTARYCQNSAISRDIILVVDMNQLKRTNNDEKIKSLQTIRSNLVNKITFPQANVLLKALVADKIQDVSGVWASSVDQLNKDFDALFAITTATETLSLDFDAILKNGVDSLRKARNYVPGAIFVITDKPLGGPVATQARELGIFVGVTGVTANNINKYAIYADTAIPYDSWTALATADPFQTLVCSFYNLPAAALTSRMSNFFEELDDQTNTPKCEVLDIIIAFDTSESLSRIILPKYVDFAKRLVAQYKYKNNDFTRVGILTFNDDVTEKLTLTLGNNLDVINQAISSVVYTGGLTDVTAALVRANQLFTTESDITRPSRVLIVLSDAVPTVDTYQDEIAAGKTLAKNGVATFFVGYSSYSDDVKKELGQVTNPNYVFGDMSDASFKGVTQQILTTYPCPLPKCVTAYFAVEISEATDDYVVKNLQDVITIAKQNAALQSGTESYQLITYNEGTPNIFPVGDASLPSFIKAVQNIIDNADFRATLRGGHTRLDTSITAVANELNNQAKKNNRFTGNIIFFGEANDAVLDPNVPTDQKKALLVAAAGNLKTVTGGLIFVVDDSRPAGNFGEDLWPSVTTNNRIIPTSDNVPVALSKTDYFTTWQKLSCSLPALLTCYDTQLDVAVFVDLQKEDDVFMNYITSILAQFSAQDDTHLSLFAYGTHDTTVLSQLAAHSAQEIQGYSGLFEYWRNGSYFVTTPAPTTTEATSTKKAANFWDNELYTVDGAKIHGLFDSISTQFGCGHYGDNGDRLFAPNYFIFASDNFAQYTDAIWAQFQTEVHSRYGCYDCAGSPTFLFLSRNAAIAPVALGRTIYLQDADLDIDPTDDTSTVANINLFNNIVNSVCLAPYPTCANYACTTAF